MAASDLKMFLDLLDEEMMQGQATPTLAIQKYRSSTGDKKAGNLTYKPHKITHALKVLGGNVPKELQWQYDIMVTRLSNDMLMDFRALEAKFPNEVVVTAYPNGEVSAFIIKKGKRNNYKTLKASYGDTLDAFYKAFVILIGKPRGLVRKSAKGKEREYTPGKAGGKGGLKFRAQTHEDGGSNVLNQMNDAVHAALAATTAASTKKDANVKAILEYLKRQGNLDAEFILSIIKDGEMGVIQYGIASSWLNSQQGGGEEQNLKDAFSRAIENLKDIVSIPGMPGSDSLIRAHRKKLIKEMVKPFKNKRGIKVKHEDLIIKDNKKPEKLIKKAGKTTLATQAAGRVKPKKKIRGQKTRPKGQKFDLKMILGVLNNQLPERVADNMGSPRLENRTGRFAQSVRATDVTQTPQGFPSIGYTYMKNRYGVYESTSGTKFSDVERDPRPLIDQSIREIAIGFGLGRLYTRRM